MLAHTRALIAASVFAFVSGRKAAGVYDHAAARHLKIAAEAKGEHLQGFDGDRSTRFGGTLPEVYDSGDEAFISLTIDGTSASGYARGASTAFTVRVMDSLVQLYDHHDAAWFAFTVQAV